jgi:glycosyltransferase involved in cell wall biosynthesis
VNILFVNERCGYFGGVEQNVADAAAGLRAKGHRCVLAYGFTAGHDPDRYKALFDESRPCAELGSDGKNGAPARFEEIVQAVAPDVIYLHKLPDLRLCDPVLSRTRTVRMVHDHDLCCPRRHKYYIFSGRVCGNSHGAGWRCWLDGAFLARSGGSRWGFKPVSLRRHREEMRRNHRLDALLVGSGFMRDELLQNGFPREKVHILPPVVRMEQVHPPPLPQEKNILYVGQLIRGKGVDLLLRALAQLSCDFSAALVGDGNARGKLESLCRGMGLSDRVQFKGWVDHSEIGQLYSWARVVAVPSRWPEPFGMIGLEAMNHGRPVVAFAVGGIPDWLEHEVTGLLAPEQDTKAMARSLDRLLSDGELAASLGRKAVERARTRFSFTEYLGKLECHLSGQEAQG